MREEGAGTKSGGTGLLAAGIVIVAVIAAGAYLSFGPEPAPSDEELAAIVGQDASVPSQDAPYAATEGGASDDEAADGDSAAEPRVAPSIDEVRLEDDGLTVIAGRAEPGAQVSVLVDGEEVATATADANGAFAAVGVVAPSDDARVLTLQANGAGAPVMSAEDVILAPLPVQTVEADPAPARPPEVGLSSSGDAAPADTALAERSPDTGGPEEVATSDAMPAPEAIQQDETVTAEAAQEPPEVTNPSQGADPVDAPVAEELATLAPNTTQRSKVPDADTVVTADETDTPSRPDVEAPSATAPAQPEPTRESEAEVAEVEPASPSQSVAVLKSTEDGVELLQSQPQVLSSIAIDTIGYSETGDVQLSGRAVAGTSEVRVYLDNRFVGGLPVDVSGGWRGEIPEVDAGIYQLRVDEVNEAGDVTSRLETPFKREAPAILAEASAGQEGPVRAVTVQTGDTLWAIARDRYGEGLLYVRVFEANRTDIRDPDLIYPGQVFDLPVE
ncbi:Ig-like domain-containing protein [uncultured Roseobacter sp.]|uniref:LysM peptidoglycan-binding domain-containing protein n=1 Tax=uncultured Roseobacter sp. TaxID=114847 RepID=UPI0026105986|nr:Ig-like domain-containing protein [uncultured Roseobacter sp.]